MYGLKSIIGHPADIIFCQKTHVGQPLEEKDFSHIIISCSFIAQEKIRHK